MDLRTFQEEVHTWAIGKGWAQIGEVMQLDRPDHRATVIEKLALIHSEVTEALEEIRNGLGFNEVMYEGCGKPIGFPTELADIVIRVLNLASLCGIDMVTELERKMDYNQKRPYRHGGKLF